MEKMPLGESILAPRSDPRFRFAYIGVPHDAATTLGNPGARFGPQALRGALKGLFDRRLHEGRLADLDRGILDLSDVEVADFGDTNLSYYDAERCVDQAYQAVLKALTAGFIPLIVGGDHAMTFPGVKALHDAHKGNVGLIQLDAHCDLTDHSERQGRFSGSSGIRRSLELERLNGANIVQVGLRGYTTVEQYQVGEEHGVRRITATEFNTLGPQATAKRALAWAGDGAEVIYLTVDLDVLTPGEAPGTGWPEPGGLTAEQVLAFVRLLAPSLSAVDIAELNPIYDSRAGTTTMLSARILLDVITSRLRAT